ncbi:MAG: sigma-70 family RNA polymerase sigma factor, partial [Lachnospiraceae bacterium]|nr:sigma-70 family RNA polymerase sigma factor [Lachnospiraceae bacterium]
ELDYEIETFSENEKELFEEVMKLPAKYSIVLHLYYYEEYSVREIAGLLYISESNVQTRLMRGRNKLKQQLQEAWA